MQQPQVTQTNSSGSGTNTILIVLVIIILLVGGYFLFAKGGDQTMDDNQDGLDINLTVPAGSNEQPNDNPATY